MSCKEDFEILKSLSGYSVAATNNRQWYYGWARLDIDTDFTYFTLKDSAYESTAGKSILAGETVSSTISNTENTGSGISAYINDKILTISLKDETLKNGSFKLFSIDGKELKSFTINDKHMIVSLKDLNNGVYILNFNCNNNVWAKKFILE